MDPFLADWLNLLLRWGHMIAGIAWIGTSFYFVALDFSLKKREGLPPGVAGEAGKSLSDQDINSMNWYVKGIDDKLPQ